MKPSVTIGDQVIGHDKPTYIVAELSGNHNQDYDRAVRLIEAAKDAGADAVKLQTYTPDTITIDSTNDYFRLKDTAWKGRTLYDVYKEAYTPWEWQPKLKKVAEKLGLHLFSSPFDATAVDFLELMDVPVYKIASSEIIDLPLLKKIAQTHKPVVISTGMATLGEIDDAITVFRDAGVSEVILLKCTAAYPAELKDMNILTIPHLAATFGVVSGLSDHSLSNEAVIASVALGGRFIEKHLTLRREDGGPDAVFSLEPEEFGFMVKAVRRAEEVLGCVSYGATDSERIARECRRSLFVVKDIKAGQEITPENVRSIRPGHGMLPKYLDDVTGCRAKRNLKKGTPLDWSLIE